MSSYFARTLNKAPTYLSPRRRPALPRTLSNSSEISISSNRSDDPAAETAHSAPGTPTFETQPRSKCVQNSSSSAPRHSKPDLRAYRHIPSNCPNQRRLHRTACYDEPPLSAAGGGHGNLPPFSDGRLPSPPFPGHLPSLAPLSSPFFIMRSARPRHRFPLCLANNLRHLGHPVSPGLSVSRSGTSRPTAIEIPQIQKKGTSSIYTPTEPLSGRGDQPG